MIFCRLLTLLKFTFQKKSKGKLSECQTVWICPAGSGSKLFAKTINRRQKSPLAGNGKVDKLLVSFEQMWNGTMDLTAPSDDPDSQASRL